MLVAGRYRVARQKDQAVKNGPQKSLAGKGSSLDIRMLAWDKGGIPLLLVSAGRKTGPAVARNRFRRRVRMAFLAALRKRDWAIQPGPSFVLWVRPARWNPAGCRIEYQDIENQIESSLGRMRLP